MSKIKLNTDLFLGPQELNRIIQFLQEGGYEKSLDQIIERYGIANNSRRDPMFTNLKIVPGTDATHVTLKAGYAIDSSGNIITSLTDQTDVGLVLANSQDHYIHISYNTTNLEEGTVDITTTGQLAGTGTSFLSVLRGQPNFPTKIKFPGSSLNTGEYEVIDVNADDDAVLAGTFTAEAGLTWQIVGTFTPDRIPDPANKNIFLFDNYTISVELADNSIDGEKFLLAIANSDGVTMVIQDRRSEFLQTKAMYEIVELDNNSIQNPLVGIEDVKYNVAVSDQSKNLVHIAWGFTSDSGSWTVNEQSNTLTINAGSGGVFKTTTGFTNGDFDGWRAYFENGTFVEINTSTRTGLVITCSLRFFNGDINQLTGALRIVPNVSEVGVAFSGSQPIASREFNFPVAQAEAVVELLAGYTYTVAYRYFHGKKSTSFQLINDGTYLKESSFDDDGNQTGTGTSSVASGAFTTVLNTGNLSGAVATLAGDNVFTGVNTFTNDVLFGIDGEIDLDVSGTLTLTQGTVFLVNPQGFDMKSLVTKGVAAIVFLIFRSSCNIIHKDNTGGNNLHTGYPLIARGNDLAVHEGAIVKCIQYDSNNWKVEFESAANFTRNLSFGIGRQFGVDTFDIANTAAANGYSHILRTIGSLTASRTWELPDLGGSLVPAPNGIGGKLNLAKTDITYRAYNDAALATDLGIIGSSAAVVEFWYMIYGKIVFINFSIINLDLTASNVFKVALEGLPFTFADKTYGVGQLGDENTSRRVSQIICVAGTNKISIGEMSSGFITPPGANNIWDTNGFIIGLIQ